MNPSPQVASIIPAATTVAPNAPAPATFVVKATNMNINNPRLPPPAMVTSVVKPIPEIGQNNNKSKGVQPSLLSMNAMHSLGIVEESKLSPRIAAPKNLAPLTSKSKATLPSLTPAPESTNFESKLSYIPNIDNSANELEFESAKTLVPNKDGQVDEIQALLGHEGSMADMATSMNTKSPNHNPSKLNMALIDSTSNAPVESTYGVN